MEEGASRGEVPLLAIEWPENALSFVGDATRVLMLPFAALVLAIQGWKMGFALGAAAGRGGGDG